MKFRSLNEAILSVTNPQPKLVKEDVQTPQRKAEGEKEIKNLRGKAKEKTQKWAEHDDESFPSRTSKIGDEYVAATNKLGAMVTKQQAERKSKTVYGLGGKIVKKATVKEEQEYIELLESALESIAEELECDVEDLLEDIQTRERQVQMKRKLKRSDNLVGKANAEVNKRERAEDRAYSNLSADDDFLKVAKTSDRADTARDNRERTDKTHSSLVNLNSREKKSKKLFGKGGKVIKKATVKEEQTAQLSPKQRAAAMKDRNSGIHRTPAELKKFAASRKAYVKSQNNMTDSKGKKLDAYDDYQS